jgi:hypothetical protein
MRAKRKLGKTIYKSKKKRKLDDARVQQETRTRSSANQDSLDREEVSEAKITNLKTGKESYMKTIDERDSKGNYSLRQMQSTSGEGGTYGDVGKGKYISFDKDMNLSSGDKKIKNIDPITLGDMVEASANKFFNKGGKMKAKKYKKGGKVGPPKGKKLTKEMVDKQHSSDLDKSANVTNKLAKQAATGMKSNGFPMKKEAVKALAKDVEKRKKRESTSKPNYRDVGKNLPGGASPRFKKGGKIKKYLKGGQVKLDANKDGKITGQDFKMLKKK